MAELWSTCFNRKTWQVLKTVNLLMTASHAQMATAPPWKVLMCFITNEIWIKILTHFNKSCFGKLRSCKRNLERSSTRSSSPWRALTETPRLPWQKNQGHVSDTRRAFFTLNLYTTILFLESEFLLQQLGAAWPCSQGFINRKEKYYNIKQKN